MKRRDFLAAAPLALAAQALSFTGVFVEHPSGSSHPLSNATFPDKTSASHELDFATALQAADAIRRKQVSSVDLTKRCFERIDRYNPALNAYVYQLRDEAMAASKKADEALAHGKSLGVFHGVPINVKESYGVAGQPCTWGIPDFRNAKAQQDSDVVSKLRDAGAVLLGATNVPVNLGDWQSFNPIYGQTNNPWDVKRTPGGSSGGSAAALAAGLGYLSAGSDIGGSIRVPSHFCGVYGHKPTLDLVSSQGQLPGGQRTAPGFSTLLAVCGPMARSAADLLAALKVMGGPVGWDAKAWKWTMPEARAKSLKDFRVGFVIDDPIAPPTPEEKVVLEKVIRQLEHAGVNLKQGWPQEYDPADLIKLYRYHMDAFFFSITPPDQQKKLLEENRDNPETKDSGAVATFADWQQKNFRRLGYRAQWQRYFQDVDVFLSPVAFTPAFPHDHSEPQGKRKIQTSSGERKYLEMFNWIAATTLTGCPATAAPVGLTTDGLPVGMQIMGPFWEDATTITFADLLAQEMGGFVKPKGFE